MGKVYESDIDPDEFIRSFREESSSLSTLKKPAEQPEENPVLPQAEPQPKPQLVKEIPSPES